MRPAALRVLAVSQVVKVSVGLGRLLQEAPSAKLKLRQAAALSRLAAVAVMPLQQVASEAVA
jgi:hypothetical protein